MDGCDGGEKQECVYVSDGETEITWLKSKYTQKYKSSIIFSQKLKVEILMRSKCKVLIRTCF